MKRDITLIRIFFAVLTLALMPLSAQASDIQMSIQFFQQQLYYEGDPVKVKITLSNESSETYRFRLADSRMFNLEFDVKDMANQPAKPGSDYIKILSDNRPIYVRDVSIQPGEEFSFVETLNDYRVLKAGVYLVQGLFHPELLGNTTIASLNSNRLSLSIRPKERKVDMLGETLQAEVQEVLQLEQIPPDQVVAFMLSARQQNRKEAFFLYLDLPSLYQKEAARGEKYRRMSETNRLDHLKEYKEQLWENMANDPLGKSPMHWKIDQTSYRDTTGEVIVTQEFNQDQFVQIMEYRYKLERKQNVWYIVDYIVNNKGTRKG